MRERIHGRTRALSLCLSTGMALAGLVAFASAPVASQSVGHTDNVPCNQTFPAGTVVGMAATQDDGGYWIANNAGLVANCGDAPNLGQLAAAPNRPIVGITATADGGGFYLVACDGGVFTFGDASFQGSTGATRLNQPIVGMAIDPATDGYWLVASDGGIFAFNAPFFGSTDALGLNTPVTGMEANVNGTGYRFVATDGGIFDFGTSQFFGSAVASVPGPPTAPSPVVPPLSPNTCAISLSNASPADGAEETATTTSNVPNAGVTLTKHYKTTTSTDSGMTDASGTAVIEFNISDASAGYTVVVDASVGTATCQTSFTPT